jgi:hypothetical protein
MDGIVTHVYYKNLANLQLGLGHSPIINERVYVVIHCDGVGTERSHIHCFWIQVQTYLNELILYSNII